MFTDRIISCQEKIPYWLNSFFFQSMTQKNMISRPSDDEARITGRNIRHLRLTKGWTQEQLARRYDCETNFISQLETGAKVAGPRTRRKLAAIFECSPQDFLNPRLEEQRAAYLTATPIHLELIYQVVTEIHAYLKLHPQNLQPHQYGRLVIKLLEHCLADDDTPSPRLVQAYLRLV